MTQLYEYFENNTGNCIDKWLHYFEIYEFWFRHYVGKPVVILEIGVYQGGSLKMWRDYFGEQAKIFAIDINPDCKQFETENTKIFIGSQEDRDFLTKVKSQIPQVDILMDDGGHSMNQQIVSFQELYGHIKSDGLYLCEDLHTSYWEVYGGGYKRKGSFVEYSKLLIDELNAWHANSKKLKVNNFTRTTYSLHFYPSMFVVKKRPMLKPISIRSGNIIIPIENFPLPDLQENFWKRILKKLAQQKKRSLKFFKKILHAFRNKDISKRE